MRPCSAQSGEVKIGKSWIESLEMESTFFTNVCQDSTISTIDVSECGIHDSSTALINTYKDYAVDFISIVELNAVSNIVLREYYFLKR